MLQVLAGEGFLIHIVLAVIARLATPLAGSADAFAAVQGDVDAIAQGGVEQDFIGLHREEQRFAVGKAERDFMVHARSPWVQR
ncbi:hypothetical protein D9M71_140140 [compost metagenome]